MLSQVFQQYIQQTLSEKFAEETLIEKVRSIGGGCINNGAQVVTNLGNFFLKWKQNAPSDLFLIEAKCLEVLQESTDILSIPKVYVATKIESERPGILVMDYLENGKSDRGQQDELLGRGLAQLHRKTNPSYGFEIDTYCGSTLQDNRSNNDWVDFYSQQRIRNLLRKIEVKRGLSTEESIIYRQFIDKLPQLINHQPKASITHGDLWSGNYIYTQAGPALIDPASYYGDRECDLALMKMFGGFSNRVWSAYQESFPLEAGWRDRVEIYQLYHYLNHYLIFGGHYRENSLVIAKSYI